MAEIIDLEELPEEKDEPVDSGLNAISVYQYFLDEMSKLTSEAKIVEALNKYGIGTDSDEDRARNVKVGVCMMTSFRQFLEKEIDWDSNPSELNNKVKKRVKAMNAEKREGLRQFEIKFVSLEETKAKEQEKEARKKKREKEREDELAHIQKEQKKAKKKQKTSKKAPKEAKTAPKASKKSGSGLNIQDG